MRIEIAVCSFILGVLLSFLYIDTVFRPNLFTEVTLHDFAQGVVTVNSIDPFTGEQYKILDENVGVSFRFNGAAPVTTAMVDYCYEIRNHNK